MMIRRVGACLLAVLAVLLPSVPSHAAPPTRIGPVQNLAASASKPGDYKVDAHWDALAGATSYEVVLSLSGVVLAKSTTTATTWSATTATGAGKVVTVTVTPFATKRRGYPASTGVTLPDVTAPVGAFDIAWTGSTATITQTALSDDGTAASAITREIDWNDGAGWESWVSGVSATHNFAGLGRWVPRVRLTDASANSVVITLPAVVIGDTAGPVATFTSGPAAAWTSFTSVTLTEVSLSDDYSPTEMLKLSADWGDGTVEPFAGSAMTHTYATAGSYTPTVFATDEAGNTTTAATTPVTVTTDAIGPTVTIGAPAKPASVRYWAYARGTILDAETGAASFQARFIEKRGTLWYAYLPGSKKWVKAGTTSASAWLKAKPAKRVPPPSGVWRVRLYGLTKGQLRIRAVGKDLAGNPSKVVERRQKLTTK